MIEICGDAEITDNENGRCSNGTQVYNKCCQECEDKPIKCRKYCDYAFGWGCPALREIEE